jgi:hypothetical protein
LLCLVVTLALQGISSVARAQAWLPTRGTLDTTVSFTDVLNKKHYLPDGSEFDAGTIGRASIRALEVFGIAPAPGSCR